VLSLAIRLKNDFRNPPIGAALRSVSLVIFFSVRRSTWPRTGP
jgi:hypothetical protein